MKENARSWASAMRWPGGRSPSRRRSASLAGRARCGGPRRGRSSASIRLGERIEALARDRPSRPPAPARDAAPARRSARRSASAPNSGCRRASKAGAISARCRGLATRFRITPAIADIVAIAARSPPRRPPPSRSGPRRRAPARPASRATPRGRPSSRAPSGRLGDAVEQAHHALGDRRGRPACRCGHQIGERAGRHRPGVEVVARPAGRRGVEGRIDIVRPALEGLHAQGRGGRSARIRPSVTVVLPAPECDAADDDQRRVRGHRQPTRRRQELPPQAGDRADHDDGRRADAVLARVGSTSAPSVLSTTRSSLGRRRLDERRRRVGRQAALHQRRGDARRAASSACRG